MSNMRFYVEALWDDEAKVFYSESDIKGLHIEAATIEDFEREVQEHAPALVLENHISRRDFAYKSLAEMIPSIFMRQPSMQSTIA